MKWIFLVALVVFVAWWYEQQKAAVSQAAGGSYGMPNTYGGGGGGFSGIEGAYSRNTTQLTLNNMAGLGGVFMPSGLWLNSQGVHLDYSIAGQYQASTGGTFGDDATQIANDPWNNGVGCRGADGIPHCVIKRNVN